MVYQTGSKTVFIYHLASATLLRKTQSRAVRNERPPHGDVGDGPWATQNLRSRHSRHRSICCITATARGAAPCCCNHFRCSTYLLPLYYAAFRHCDATAAITATLTALQATIAGPRITAYWLAGGQRHHRAIGAAYLQHFFAGTAAPTVSWRIKTVERMPTPPPHTPSSCARRMAPRFGWRSGSRHIRCRLTWFFIYATTATTNTTRHWTYYYTPYLPLWEGTKHYHTYLPDRAYAYLRERRTALHARPATAPARCQRANTRRRGPHASGRTCGRYLLKPVL